MTFTIKKSTIIFWIVVFILQVAIIAHIRGLITIPTGFAPIPAPVVEITPAEAELVISAINIARKGVSNGMLSTVEAVADELFANSPIQVREQIVKIFDTPDNEKLPEALDDLEVEIKKYL